MRILIEHGTILTLGAKCRVLEGQALLIEGGRIARVAPASTSTDPSTKFWMLPAGW